MTKANDPEELKKKLPIVSTAQNSDEMREKKEIGEREHRLPSTPLPNVYDTRKNIQALQETPGWDETKTKISASGQRTDSASGFGEIKIKTQVASNPATKDLARFEETRRTVIFKDPFSDEGKPKPMLTGRTQEGVEAGKAKTQIFNLTIPKEEPRRVPAASKETSESDKLTPPLTARVAPTGGFEIIRSKTQIFNLAISKDLIKKEENRAEPGVSSNAPAQGSMFKSKTLRIAQSPKPSEAMGNKPESVSNQTPPVAISPGTAEVEGNEGTRLVLNLRDRGVIAASLMPKVGKDKAAEYFDLNYKTMMLRITAHFPECGQPLYYLAQQMQLLLEHPPYSPQASQIADSLGAFDIYQYFSTIAQSMQRFSEAVYLLACMNRDNTSLSQIINKECLRNMDNDLFPAHKVKFYRRIADIFANFLPQDFAIMNLRDRSVIIAALLPMLGVEKVSKYFKAIFKPFLSHSMNAEDEFAGKLRFINSVMQKLLLLPAFNEETKKLTSQLFGREAYLFFYAARHNPQRFAEASYLLCRLNLSSQPLFRFVNIERLLYPDMPLFPEDYTKLFRRESDLWDSLPSDSEER